MHALGDTVSDHRGDVLVVESVVCVVTRSTTSDAIRATSSRSIASDAVNVTAPFIFFPSSDERTIAAPSARSAGAVHDVAAITREAPAVAHPRAASAAIALRACLDDAGPLSPGERLLLDELLARLSGPR